MRTDSTGIKITGPQGSQGAQGATGSQGAQGAQGSQGAQGTAAWSVSCRVYNASAQTISTGTNFTDLSWDHEFYDTSSIHDNSTNNKRLTAPEAGKYLVMGTAVFAANATGRREICFSKNAGADGIIYGRYTVQGQAGAGAILTTICEINLAANDYVIMAASQNSGGNLDVSSGDSWFGMMKVGE